MKGEGASPEDGAAVAAEASCELSQPTPSGAAAPDMWLGPDSRAASSCPEAGILAGSDGSWKRPGTLPASRAVSGRHDPSAEAGARCLADFAVSGAAARCPEDCPCGCEIENPTGGPNGKLKLPKVSSEPDASFEVEAGAAGADGVSVELLPC